MVATFINVDTSKNKQILKYIFQFYLFMTLITRVLQSVSEKGNPTLACMPLNVNYSVYEDSSFHNRKDQAFGCRTTCFSSIIQ
jgi:hypothetical protein